MSDTSTLTNLEQLALSQPEDSVPPAAEVMPSDDEWLFFCLHTLIAVSSQLRQARFDDLSEKILIKTDGTPVSSVEERIETLCQEKLTRFCPDAAVVGEEHGGEIDESGISLAIDPIDGTWSFVNRAETFATTLALFRHGQVEMGFVANPATGEIAYASNRGISRLLQLGLSGQPAKGYRLPLQQPSPLLVNIHPNRTMGQAMANLVAAWQRKELSLVKATGGSPIWSLLDVAKGACTYANLWPGKPADPYDLAAGITIVRSAGGEILDLSGNPIAVTGHTGPFVAGVNTEHVTHVIELLRDA